MNGIWTIKMKDEKIQKLQGKICKVKRDMNGKKVLLTFLVKKVRK